MSACVWCSPKLRAGAAAQVQEPAEPALEPPPQPFEPELKPALEPALEPSPQPFEPALKPALEPALEPELEPGL